MPIMIATHERDDGQTAWGPVVVCDVCEEVIERAEEGWYWFKLSEPGGALALNQQPVYFAHKPHCNNQLEREMESDGSVWGSEELSRLPIFLENRLDVDRDSGLAKMWPI